jgi:hypothetical protein
MGADGTTIVEATSAYEDWLAQQTLLVPSDVALKHARMSADRFAFFRATYYRWAERWPSVLPELAATPVVLGVGDLHFENFGTWRDRETRLVWGVNDFDEAHPVAYANDLVRLATSVLLAIQTEHLTLRPPLACRAILAGYRGGLSAGGRPFVLAEDHPWLRRLAWVRLRAFARFWRRLYRPPLGQVEPPPHVGQVLESDLPDRDASRVLFPRIAGEGSLGHQRWVAMQDWRGGRLAREAKARAPSAAVWCASSSEAPPVDPYAAIVARAVRAPDPFLQISEQWLVRRLAPDCSRVELAELPGRKHEVALLEAMGWETANIHLGTPEMQAAIARDLDSRANGWLLRASRQMLRAVVGDWRAWRKQMPAPPSKQPR